MLSFSQKIFLTYLVAFVCLAILTFPLVTYVVQTIASKAMADRADELVATIQGAPNNDALIRRVQEQKPLIFFRVTIISSDKKILYDSHAKRQLGPRFSQEYIVDRPEVVEAIKKGIGYSEDYSEIYEQKFSYLAKTFDFHGKKYVIRTAFPYKYFNDLTRDCEIGFLGLSAVILLLFSIMTWFIINHFTKPIQQIIKIITPYQEGKQNVLPEIKLRTVNANDEFTKLAKTLNSLSGKIQRYIDSLISERNEKEAILESLVEGVIAVDRDMITTYINKMAFKLLENEKEFVIGQNFNSMQQPESYALLASCQKEKRALTSTLTLQKEDGKKLYLDIIAAPKGENSGAILVMQDKSSHYKLLEMRKDFIANASHELKTPITIIRGFAEALHDNPNLPEETRETVTRKIVNNCKRMTTLIKDLLTLSDIDNIPLSRLSTIDLSLVIEDCANTVLELFPEAIINIHLLPNPNTSFSIVVDPSLMELALINLIENAAKYSQQPAHIDIFLEKITNKIKITIVDQGIGIPKNDLEHIFERFYTVDKAHSQKMGGSGLGLSIVQTIIHKHFGQISVKSEIGKGSTFTIILPCIP